MTGKTTPKRRKTPIEKSPSHRLLPYSLGEIQPRNMVDPPGALKNSSNASRDHNYRGNRSTHSTGTPPPNVSSSNSISSFGKLDKELVEVIGPKLEQPRHS